MASNYNASYKRFNGVDWDTFYFETTIAQVNGLQPILDDLADITNSVYYVQGNTTGTAGTWTGTISGLTAYYNGLKIAYHVGISPATQGNTTININNLGAITIRGNSGSFSVSTSVDSVLYLTYITISGTSYFVWSDTTGSSSVSKADLQNLYIYAKASAAITKGQAVQFDSAQGNHILIKPAVPSEINSNPDYMLGIAETSLATNDFGYVIINGRLNLDTSSYSAGDILYFASAGSTAGALTTTEPTGGEAIIQLAVVTISGVGNGEFVVRKLLLSREIHEIIDLQDSLDAKVAKSGDTMTGDLEISNSAPKIILTDTDNDSDFHIVNANGQLSIKDRTNSVNRLSIESNGNVGIGTDTPARKLHINSGTNDIGLVVESTDQFAKIGLKDNTTTSDAQVLIAASGNDMFLEAGGSEKVRIKSDGKVGIGTSSPSKELTVIGDAVFGNSSDGIRLQNGAIVGADTNGSAYNDITLRASSTAAVTIDTSNNVGIGTTSPAYKLDIVNDSGVDLRLKDTSSSNEIRFDAGESGNFIDFYTSPLYIRYQGSSTSNIVMNTSGNVGIGTTSPTEKLTVYGDSNTSENSPVTFIKHNFTGTHGFGLSISRDNSDIAALALGSNSSLHGVIVANNQNLVLGTISSGVVNDAINIKTSGNVGIGTDSPNDALHLKKDTYKHLVLDRTENTNVSSLYTVGVSYSGGNEYLRLGTTGSEIINLLDTGNVGIGTSTPNLVNAGREVTISGQDYAFLNLQGSQTTDTSNVSGLTFNNLISGTNTNISAILARRSGANNSGRLIFQTNNAGTNSEKMTIMPNGAVGIGTSSPDDIVEIYGNGGLTITDDVTSGGLSPHIFLNRGGGGYGSYKLEAISAKFNIDYTTDNSNFTNRLTVDSSGNVGINTTSPSQKLEVSGNSLTTGYSYVKDSNRGLYGHASNNRLVVRSEGVDGVAEFANYGIYLPITTQDTNLYLARGMHINYTNNSSGGLIYHKKDIIFKDAGNSNVETFRIKENGSGINVTGDLNVAGDIIQQGSAYETHAEQVYTTQDKIFLREGAIAGLGSGEYVGLEAILADGTNNSGLLFDGNGIARIGDVTYDVNGNPVYTATQAIATREDAPNNNGIAFWDSTTSKFETSGNLTYNGSQLDVIGKAQINGGTGVSTTGVLVVRQDGDTSNNGIAITSSNSTSHRIWKDANGKLNIGPTSLPSSLVQDLSGNVGIGTNSPAHKLNVYNGTANFSLGYDTSGNYPTLYADTVLRIAQRTQIFGGSGGYYLDVRNSSGQQNAQIGGQNVDTFFAALNGNVGIGTTSPAYKLDVSGTARISSTVKMLAGTNYNENLRMSASTNGYSSIAFGADPSTDTGTQTGQWTLVRYPQATHSYKFAFRHSGTDVMTMLTSGNVGIGTGSPSQKLQVNGNINAAELHLNDTDTILKEGTNNAVRIQTNSGYVDVGPKNTAWSHFETDRGRFYFNKGVDVDGDIRPYTNNTTKIQGSTGYIFELGERVATRAVFEPGNSGGSRRFIRLFTLNGSSNTFGASADVILSGAGDYGDFDRTSLRIMAGERNNSVTVDVYQLNAEDTSDAPIIYWKSTGTSNEFEIWAQLADWNQTHQLNILNKSGSVTINLDSITTTTPSSLNTVTNNTLWHSGNDGSGSGLDADTLDGSQASDFVAVTGDTMTGNLSIENGAPSLTLKDTTDSDDIRIYFVNSANSNVAEFTTTGNRLNIGTSFTNGLSIDADKVGIGTTSPQDVLNIHNSSSSANLGLKITRGTQTHGLRLGVNNNHAFLWTSENQNLAFATNGYERMTIAAGGNVGIGTTSPSNKLVVETSTVADSLVINNTSTAVQTGNNFGLVVKESGNDKIYLRFRRDNSGVAELYNVGNSNLALGANNSEKVTITPSGNVGIGTTSPAVDLHIKGSTAAVRVDRDATSYGGTYQWAEAGTLLWEMKADQDGGNNNSLQISTASAPTVTFEQSGNVGIGTTSPGEKLQVTENNGRSDISIHRDGSNLSTNTDIGRISFDADYNSSLINYAFIKARSNDISGLRGSLDFDVKSTGGSLLTGLSLYGTSSGVNVGIGTTTPSNKLHIVGDTRIEGDLTVNGTMTVVDTDTTTTEQLLITNDGTGPAVVVNQTGAQPVIDIQDDGVSAFYIEDGGNVGIKTTNPTTTLQVAGRALANILSTTTTSTRDKIRLYDTSAEYTIGMQGGVSYGGLNSDWAMTFQFNNDSDRGFWWGDTGHSTAQGAMALTTQGLLTVASKIRVGYGESDTTIPATYALDVSGNAHLDYSLIGRGFRASNRGELFLNATGTNDVSEIFFGFGDGYTTDSNIRWGISDRGTTTGKLNFYRGPANGGFAAVMTFTNDTKVGIGTDSPSYGLDVHTDGGQIRAYGTTAKLWAEASDSGQASLELKNTEGHFRFITDNGTYTIYDQTDAAERFKIDTSGNVGIGETTPLAKLHIKDGNAIIEQGNLYIASSADAEGGEGGGGTGRPTLWFSESEGTSVTNQAMGIEYDGDGLSGNNNRISIVNGGSNELVVFQTGGNVGIGTITPDARLNVADANSGLALLGIFENTTNAGGTSAGIQLRNASDTDVCAVQLSANRVQANAGSDFVIELSDASAGTLTERFRITEAGKVGIGTNSPTGQLEIVGDDGLYIKTTTNNPTDGAQIRFSDNASGGTYAQYGFIKYKHADTTVETEPTSSGDGFIIGGSEATTVVSIQGHLNVENQTNFENQVEIDSGDLLVRNGDLDVNGQAKIGSGLANARSYYGLTAGFTSNATFSSNADVQDSNRTLSLVNESTTTNTYSTLSFRNSPTSGTSMADFKYVHRGTNDGDLIYTNNNGGTWTDQFSILSNGNVGIGTTSPREKLDVIGKIQISNGLTLRDNSIEQHLTNGNANVAVNYYGYANGHSQFRDFDIYNGKGGLIAQFEGATSRLGVGTGSPTEKLDVYGNVKAQEHILADSSNVEKAKMVYDSTSQSVKFVFA